MSASVFGGTDEGNNYRLDKNFVTEAFCCFVPPCLGADEKNKLIASICGTQIHKWMQSAIRLTHIKS